MADQRRTRLPAHALAGETSRELIISAPRMVETSRRVVTVVTVRGSMPIVAISLPLLVIPGILTPEVLPALMLLLTAAHGSSLVHQWVRRR